MTSRKPLFVYGSMLDEDVLRVVLDRTAPPSARRGARLLGYRRVRLPDESYPILSPAPNGIVNGVLISDLQEEDWKRVQFFESEEYEFAPCRVELDNGRSIDALYCAEGEVASGATEIWRLDWWRERYKVRYMVMIRQYMALYGNAGLEEAEALWGTLSAQADPPCKN